MFEVTSIMLTALSKGGRSRETDSKSISGDRFQIHFQIPLFVKSVLTLETTPHAYTHMSRESFRYRLCRQPRLPPLLPTWAQADSSRPNCLRPSGSSIRFPPLRHCYKESMGTETDSAVCSHHPLICLKRAPPFLLERQTATVARS